MAPAGRARRGPRILFVSGRNWPVGDGLIYDTCFGELGRGSKIPQEFLSTERVSAPRKLSMKLTRSVGMLLLAVWLILSGLVPLLRLSFSGLGTVMAVLAIAAGILIAVGR